MIHLKPKARNLKTRNSKKKGKGNTGKKTKHEIRNLKPETRFGFQSPQPKLFSGSKPAPCFRFKFVRNPNPDLGFKAQAGFRFKAQTSFRFKPQTSFLFEAQTRFPFESSKSSRRICCIAEMHNARQWRAGSS